MWEDNRGIYKFIPGFSFLTFSRLKLNSYSNCKCATQPKKCVLVQSMGEKIKYLSLINNLRAGGSEFHDTQPICAALLLAWPVFCCSAPCLQQTSPLSPLTTGLLLCVFVSGILNEMCVNAEWVMLPFMNPTRSKMSLREFEEWGWIWNITSAVFEQVQGFWGQELVICDRPNVNDFLIWHADQVWNHISVASFSFPYII